MIEITYDRKERVYKWIDPDSGEILTAPAKQKAELFRAAVGMLEPNLYKSAERITERHLQLERITWKAVEIVANNGVEIFPGAHNGVAAMVDSSDGFGRYAIISTEYGPTCQCAHFQEGYAPLTESGARYCKHIMAYQLHLTTREDRF